jgi:preprotein translocase subunit SecA
VLDYFLVVDALPRKKARSTSSGVEEIEDLVVGAVREGFRRKLESWGDHRDRILSWVLLGVIDEKWRDHLYDLDHLKASIAFRGWGQKDPLIEYKQEAYSMFVDMMTDLRRTVSTLAFRAQLAVPQPQPVAPRKLSGPDRATRRTRSRWRARPSRSARSRVRRCAIGGVRWRPPGPEPAHGRAADGRWGCATFRRTG